MATVPAKSSLALPAPFSSWLSHYLKKVVAGGLRVRGICLRIISLLCLSVTVAGSAQEDRQTAQALWEEAIAAKGGRERLAGIRSFAILEKTRFRGLMTRDVARGKVDQIVCELPDGWWEFLDYRPGLMGYSVNALNTLSGLGWVSPNGAPARPFLRPNTNAAYRMRQLQYVYFLQTRSVQPRPLSASRVRLGLRSADRVDAVIDDESVVFYLDPTTHLPLRIETSRKITLKPPRPDIKGTGQLKYVFVLADYQEVGGVKVPGRVNTAESRVEINPDYDPRILTNPPASDATIDSWRRRTDRKQPDGSLDREHPAGGRAREH